MVNFKKILAIIKNVARPVVVPIYTNARRYLRYLTWQSSALKNLLLPVSTSKKRLLLVYDTSGQPFSLGDILMVQAASLSLRADYGVDKVDFALIFPPHRPAAADPAYNSITADNVMFHLASVLPVAQVNQHLGSLLVFDSSLHLQRYISDCADLYHVWPEGQKFAFKDYLYYEIFNEVLYKQFKRTGGVLPLTGRPVLIEWAKKFYQDNARPRIPVTVNIRNNMAYQVHRNTNIEAWIEFFEYCETRYPAVFVVICAFSEIDERLRKCGNVIIAKDHHTGIEQELALIHASAIHMGVGSGPMSMAWFDTKPYLMVNTYYGPKYFKHPDMVVQVEPGIQRFCFANSLQRIVNGVETKEVLIEEFARMWTVVDPRSWWGQPAKEGGQGSDLQTWLR